MSKKVNLGQNEIVTVNAVTLRYLHHFAAQENSHLGAVIDEWAATAIDELFDELYVDLYAAEAQYDCAAPARKLALRDYMDSIQRQIARLEADLAAYDEEVPQ